MSDWIKKEYGDVFNYSHNDKFEIATIKDVIEFKKTLDDDEGWTLDQDKNGTKVLFRDASNESVLQIKLRSMALKDIPVEVLHDVIQDPQFRAEWDASMKNQRLVEQLDENNEIGYYSVKMPFTVANRDWVNMRSWWFNKERTLFIIMNHSVQHDKEPENKDFVRANSLKTGYIIEKTEEGSKLSFFSWNSWNGWIPTWVVNKATKSMIAQIIDDLRKACNRYPEWKKAHNPEEKYWMNEGKLIQEYSNIKEE